MSKLTTDVLLKESIKSILTELVNSTYDWQEYTDSEISDILEISDEQALELSKIINDNVKANNKLWSSNKIDSELQNMIIEANKYSDELIGQISSISLEYVTVLPDTDIKSNVIYILQGTPNTLNVYNNSTSAFVTVGDLNIDLTNYYTKSEVDAELIKKANADEVLKPDAIVADLTTTSGSTTLSTAGLQTELDKKANDDEVLKTTDISTTIDGTSTNDTVPTNKAVYDSLLNKVNNTIVLTTADEVNSFDRAYQSFIIEPPVAEAVGLPKAPDSTWFCINLSHIKGFKYPSQIAFEYAGIERIMYRTAHNGVWHNWKKLCTTSVADVGKINLTAMVLNATVNSGGGVYYSIKNGICYLQIHSVVTTVASSAKTIIGSGCLPIPDMNFTNGHYALASPDSKNGLLVVAADGSAIFYGGAMTIFSSFSYPVKES